MYTWIKTDEEWTVRSDKPHNPGDVVTVTARSGRERQVRIAQPVGYIYAIVEDPKTERKITRQSNGTMPPPPWLPDDMR